VVPKLENLNDQQIASINNLRLSSQQAEDALSIGLEKLQQSMINNIQADPLDFGNYGFQMAAAMDKGEAVEGFVIQVINITSEFGLVWCLLSITHNMCHGNINVYKNSSVGD